jgi:DNA primase
MQNSTIKYVIYAGINADGIVERSDVVGAIFGQTEGLIGDELDLRDLQKTGRVGRIDVNIDSKAGKSKGMIEIPSSLDKIETAIMAAALETIDKVGPCTASINVARVEDIRATKREQIRERAKAIMKDMFEGVESREISEKIKQDIRIEEITTYGKDNLPSGPNISDSDAILVVEGRADVLALLKYGIKNAIAVEGTNIAPSILDLSRKKVVTAFIDGDRGGELILKELLQVAEVDYVAKAPHGKEVEELTQKEIVKALRNKVPVEQVEIKEQKKKMQTQKKGVNDFKLHAEKLSGTMNARLLNQGMEILKEVAVRDLSDVMKKTEGVRGIVFDGVITQRILDLAEERNIKYLIGAKMGRIVHTPVSVKVLTTEDL